MTDGTTPWRGTGNTDRSSFIKALSRSVNPGASPMAAEASDVYEVLRRYGLTRLGAAMAWHERKNDSWKPAYGLDSSFNNPWALKLSMGQWARFTSYEEAAQSFASRLTSLNGPYAMTDTLAELVHVYAPASDGNDEAAYVAAIAREIDALPRLSSGGTMAANPFPTPVVYDLMNDAHAARYSLTPAERDRLMTKRIPNRNGANPTVIVLHIQDGVTAGSLDWWANNANASSTVLTNKDGSLVRCIPEQHGPWTNGNFVNPTVVGKRVQQQFGNQSNAYSLTIEAEGRPGDIMSQAHLNTIAWVCWEWMQKYNIPLSNVIRHADIDQQDRSYCPGAYYIPVYGMLSAGQSDPWQGSRPAWLSLDAIADLFPEAKPGGIRSEAWMKYATTEGRAPRRVKFHAPGTAQELIEFSDGLFIDRQGKLSIDL